MVKSFWSKTISIVGHTLVCLFLQFVCLGIDIPTIWYTPSYKYCGILRGILNMQGESMWYLAYSMDRQQH
jgi:hypothetical protein